MEQPEGTKEPGKEDWICHLNKSVYGLHQASWQWSKKLYDCLTKEGFTHCAAEHSIFTQPDTMGTVVLAIHVDDLPVMEISHSAFDITVLVSMGFFTLKPSCRLNLATTELMYAICEREMVWLGLSHSMQIPSSHFTGPRSTMLKYFHKVSFAPTIASAPTSDKEKH